MQWKIRLGSNFSRFSGEFLFLIGLGNPTRWKT